jgi:hypothetical protein
MTEKKKEINNLDRSDWHYEIKDFRENISKFQEKRKKLFPYKQKMKRFDLQ